MTIHQAREAQIALLLIKEVIILTEYADFANGFLQESAKILSERTGINKYAIKLVGGKQLLYGSIYSLGLVKF